jgi:hypothetical protein
VILNAKSPDGKQFLGEIEFWYDQPDKPPTFKFLQYHDYESFALGVSIVWGI